MSFYEYFYKILTVQSIAVLIIIISIFTMKWFFKDFYRETEKFYRSQILVDTEISEVIPYEI